MLRSTLIGTVLISILIVAFNGAVVLRAASAGNLDEKDLQDETTSRQEKVLASDPALLLEVHKLVQKAHRYLAERQNKDGSFSIDPQDISASAPIAVTAIACLSFMAGGSTPERGEFSRQLRDGLSYLCKACNERGELVDDRDSTSKMHGQGFALLALAEAYGMYGISDKSVDRKKLEDVIKKSVALMSEIQTEVGGWYYDAKKTSEHEGSITICIIQGLRAARNAGVHVDREIIDKAVQYVRRSQKKSDGSFRYRLNSDKTSFALTAAAVATLNATGDYDSEVIDLALGYMLKKDPVLNQVSHFRDQYPQYARFYSAQAYYHYRDRSSFDRWFPRLVEEASILQRDDGAFGNTQFGPVYATATTALTLQIPFGYLPIFQR